MEGNPVNPRIGVSRLNLMLVRCPDPCCSHSFSVDENQTDKRGHYRGHCLQCGRLASFRPHEAQLKLEAELRLRADSHPVKGGPERAAGFVCDRAALVEDVRSLWNVGSIFRTADGAGFEHLYLCGITGTPPRKEIEKVSLGAEESVSWQYCLNPLSVTSDLKSNGIFLLGLEVTDQSELLADAIKTGKISSPLCLILGNEVTGVSPQLLTECDLVCHLPMRGMKESLNVAVAYGIAAYLIAESMD
jgi:tRNA G18 (ribose-2'-O)-methylase SpoU